jgi:hypothetical protein
MAVASSLRFWLSWLRYTSAGKAVLPNGVRPFPLRTVFSLTYNQEDRLLLADIRAFSDFTFGNAFPSSEKQKARMEARSHPRNLKFRGWKRIPILGKAKSADGSPFPSAQFEISRMERRSHPRPRKKR